MNKINGLFATLFSVVLLTPDQIFVAFLFYIALQAALELYQMVSNSCLLILILWRVSDK